MANEQQSMPESSSGLFFFDKNPSRGTSNALPHQQTTRPPPPHSHQVSSDQANQYLNSHQQKNEQENFPLGPAEKRPKLATPTKTAPRAPARPTPKTKQKLTIAAKASKRSTGDKTIYIGNLHSWVTQEIVEKMVESFGKPESIKLLPNGNTENESVCAVVEFSDTKAPRKAIDTMNGLMLSGRQAICGYLKDFAEAPLSPAHAPIPPLSAPVPPVQPAQNGLLAPPPVKPSAVTPPAPKNAPTPVPPLQPLLPLPAPPAPAPPAVLSLVPSALKSAAPVHRAPPIPAEVPSRPDRTTAFEQFLTLARQALALERRQPMSKGIDLPRVTYLLLRLGNVADSHFMSGISATEWNRMQLTVATDAQLINSRVYDEYLHDTFVSRFVVNGSRIESVGYAWRARLAEKSVRVPLACGSDCIRAELIVERQITPLLQSPPGQYRSRKSIRSSIYQMNSIIPIYVHFESVTITEGSAILHQRTANEVLIELQLPLDAAAFDGQAAATALTNIQEALTTRVPPPTPVALAPSPLLGLLSPSSATPQPALDLITTLLQKMQEQQAQLLQLQQFQQILLQQQQPGIGTTPTQFATAFQPPLLPGVLPPASPTPPQFFPAYPPAVIAQNPLQK